VIAVGACVLFYRRLETVAAMYAGLGASLPFPLRLHIFSARPLSWTVLPLVALATLWLWRRNPKGLGAAKLVSVSGLIALLWTVVGLLLGLHTLAFDLIEALR
jgi:hypothetical protein